MSDPTEGIRREAVAIINSRVESDDKDAERARLEATHGQVWDTRQLQEDFTVQGFAAPLCLVTRKSDGKKGALVFQHWPRFYFEFTEGSE
jgi:hypothetical protein